MTRAPLHIYINGQLSPISQAKISVLDHACLYGDSCFETVRSYGGKIFALDEHLDRLERSAKLLHLKLPAPRKTLARWMTVAAKYQAPRDARIRMMITRGMGPVNLDLRPCKKGQVLVFSEAIRLSGKGQTRGINTIISSIRKTPTQTLDSRIKSGNYLFSILAYHEGLKAGVPEVVLLNHQGNVSEGTTSNIFLIKKGVLITPDLDSDCLDGITRKTILRVAKILEIPTREQRVSVRELLAADEVFFTGSVRELVPVEKIGSKVIRTKGPRLVPALQAAFSALVRETLHHHA